MMLVATNANYILPIPVDGRYVPGILDASSGNWVRIKSITDLRVLSFVGSSEAKYSSTELNLGRLRERGWCIVFQLGVSIPNCLAYGAGAETFPYGRRYDRDLR